MTRAEMIALLDELDVGHLAVIDNGEPYVTPISYVHAHKEILFRTGAGRRMTALKENPRACIEFSSYSHETGDWSSVIVWGNAEVVTDAEKEADAIGLILVKYRDVLGSALHFSRPDPLKPEEFVVSVQIETMTGRSSGSGLAERTRPGRL